MPARASIPYDDDAQRAGLSIEPGVVLDTTNGFADAPTPLDLAGTLPPTGTTVEVSGARLGSYIGVCRHDPGVDSACPSDEQDVFEVLVFDRASRHAIRVLVRDLPEFTGDADLTGLLRREERAVDDARTGAQVDFSALDLTVSDRYVLDEAAAAGTAPLTFALAGLVAAVAGVILVGWAGGYLIYRRSDRGLPVPATQPRRRRTDPAPDHRGPADADRSRARSRGARGAHPVRARAPGHDLARGGCRRPAILPRPTSSATPPRPTTRTSEPRSQRR